MESSTVEWKESWNADKCLKVLCAFNNTRGGTMTIGINDQGKIVGVKDQEALLKVIPDTIRNKLAIEADVEPVEIEGKACIDIKVEKGVSYVHLEGVYYEKVGSTTQKVYGKKHDLWTLSNMEMSWTDRPAAWINVDELSKDAIDLFIRVGTESKRMSPEAAKSDRASLLKKYGLMRDKGLCTSGALLFMNDPAKTFISAGVIISANDENDRLLRFDIVDCPVVMQPDRVMDVLLDKYIQGTGDVERLSWVMRYPYPVKALREAVMNAIVHRDYSRPAQTYIRVYPDHVEITNPGSLPNGWTEENLFEKHASELRNPAIAKVFFDMGYIEAFGRGIGLIRDECKAMNLPEPEYSTHLDNLTVTFRLPPKAHAEEIPERAVALDGLTPTELKVYNVITEGLVNTRAEIAESIVMSDAVVKRAISVLIEKGLIKRIGSDKSGRWIKSD